MNTPLKQSSEAGKVAADNLYGFLPMHENEGFCLHSVLLQTLCQIARQGVFYYKIGERIR
ncbi:hypothetical protein [Oceanobacillus massiliensis]|uniref:hypothetical protein n=1 Tax=Oceanobacillus massiliensis TaxID=1465765 RepID=UPI0002EA670A|nr:hypothetical protein [Oceanobacillus massiliensis]